jgi:hypothetical protein
MRSTGGNSRLPQWGLKWLNQVQCFYQHLCLVDSEVLKSPTAASRQNVIRKRPWESPEKIRFDLVGFFHRPASTQKLNRIEINHDFQRPNHHFA